MEDIIKKAIEGGYKNNEWKPNWIMGEELTVHIHSTVLDPAFWQALGKSCGWRYCTVHSGGNVEVRCEDQTHDEWFERAMAFHHINLISGWDSAIEYLKSITT